MLKYTDSDSFDRFIHRCDQQLLAPVNRKRIQYPSSATWDAEAIKQRNLSTFDDLAVKANLYAIFIARNGSSSFRRVYIGQTKSKYARTRLTNHLIKKHHETGAKLDRVRTHNQSGGKLKIAWISIAPMYLRHSVEEKLLEIHENELCWNGRKKESCRNCTCR